MRRTDWLRRGAAPATFVDAFGAPAPWWWWRRTWPEAGVGTATACESDGPSVELLTHSQLRQLGLSAEVLTTEAVRSGLAELQSLATDDTNVAVKTRSCRAVPRRLTTQDALVSRACLAHSRLRCEVSLTRGDVAVTHDAWPFLTCRGRALAVNNEASFHALTAATKQFAYELPFWLSLADLQMLLRYQITPFHSLSPSELLVLADGVFAEKSSRAVRLDSDRETNVVMVNVAEVLHRPPDTTDQNRMFYVFRRFEAIGVTSHEPFHPDVQDAIRGDCCHSGCWCSVWDTEAAFAECGAPTLPEPLGIYVFDAHGDELFLTNALCCEDPLQAYSRVYPHRSMYCVF